MQSYEKWREKAKPMGPKRLRLPFSASVTIEEAEHASAGLLPLEMEDKWCGFWSVSEIGFHRSWTGQQIYRLPVNKTDSGYEVGPLEVVDDVSVYRRNGDAADIDMAARLLDRLTKKNEGRA